LHLFQQCIVFSPSASSSRVRFEPAGCFWHATCLPPP
jgi:hypothetical protein